MKVHEPIIPGQEFYQRYAREARPDRRTQDIIADLKLLRMTHQDDAIMRGVLFGELAVKHERGRV